MEGQASLQLVLIALHISRTIWAKGFTNVVSCVLLTQDRSGRAHLHFTANRAQESEASFSRSPRGLVAEPSQHLGELMAGAACLPASAPPVVPALGEGSSAGPETAAIPRIP